MALGRITRFAPTPAGATRVDVMRAARAGMKALAPPPDLYAGLRPQEGGGAALLELARGMDPGVRLLPGPRPGASAPGPARGVTGARRPPASTGPRRRAARARSR